jgi:hypothetical protein
MFDSYYIAVKLVKLFLSDYLEVGSKSQITPKDPARRDDMSIL